jgi:hypothetical protein
VQEIPLLAVTGWPPAARILVDAGVQVLVSIQKGSVSFEHPTGRGPGDLPG